MAIFGPIKNNNKRTTNRNWYRPAEKKDPNVMDVDTLTFEERQTLMKQGKCFKCRRTGHRAADCPGEEDKNGKKKEELQKVNPVKNAFATILLDYVICHMTMGPIRKKCSRYRLT